MVSSEQPSVFLKKYITVSGKAFGRRIISTAIELSGDLESLDYSANICPNCVALIAGHVSVYSTDIQMHEYAVLSTAQSTMSADIVIHDLDIKYLKDRKSV